MNIKRSEIWMVNLDPTLGAEIRKTRPVVVISSDAVRALPIRLVAPLTEWKEYFSRNAWHVKLVPDHMNGLDKTGQAEAIAYNLYKMSTLKTPIISVVTGEGGSGGALALGVADRVYMLSNTIYSVISPEGCAAILWRDATKADEAAEALKLTAQNLYEFDIIDAIIEEPGGGAHEDHETTARRLKNKLLAGFEGITATGCRDPAGAAV
jgi:mRNA-degrading endonuclease toxin of MazEF toxin-antitoxin module